MSEAREVLISGKIIPFFDLPSNKGKRIKSWDYKQRKHLVIYFFAGITCTECRETLRAFADNYYSYRRLNTEVLAIGKGSVSEIASLADTLDLPFPVLADENGEVSNKYTQIDPGTNMPLPSIFIADKYGSLEDNWVAKTESELPQREELLSILQLFEIRCPE